MASQDKNGNSGPDRENRHDQGRSNFDTEDNEVRSNITGQERDSYNKEGEDAASNSFNAENRNRSNESYNSDFDNDRSNADTTPFFDAGNQYQGNEPGELNNPQYSDNSRTNFNSSEMDDDDTLEDHFGDGADHDESLLDDSGEEAD